ncbi:MAG: hypothetical protein LBB67_07430 [Oscillospiraceae bacterium]|jgi:hypothetical protein|nr:hypothetical protein [Oscillospiraceae bacterium]
MTVEEMRRLAEILKAKNALQEAGALEQLAETGISEARRQQLRSVMEDKEKMRAMLQSDQAKAFMKHLGQPLPQDD